jgi:hypothetical protein
MDAMIDKATGYKPKPPPKGKIRLYCRTCKRSQYADKEDTDPPNCAIIDVTCPDCNHGDHVLVDYFDEAGRQIDLDGNLMDRENTDYPERLSR